ncbi:Ionotropic receptor 878 [Blattella germanica]|nr:Ionotropic receptor 878 [Blattella germanica]
MFLQHIIILFHICICCESLLKLPHNDDLEHHIAECVLNIIVNHYDVDLPLLVHTPGKKYPIGDEIIQKLHNENRFTQITFRNIGPLRMAFEKPIKVGYYVMIFPPLNRDKNIELLNKMLEFTIMIVYNRKAKMIFICLKNRKVPHSKETYVDKLLAVSVRANILDTIALEPQLLPNATINNISVTGWKANEQSNLCSLKLDNIRQLDTWMTDKKVFQHNFTLFPTDGEINLWGCKLRFSMDFYYPLQYHNTVNKKEMIGPMVEYYKLIMRLLNVTFVAIFYQTKDTHINFPYSYSLADFDDGQCSMTYPYFLMDFTWFVPAGLQNSRWKCIFNTFNRLTWFFVLLMFIYGCCTTYVLQKTPKHSTSPVSSDLFMALLSALLNHLGVGVRESYKGPVANIFFVLWLFYCMIINTAYQSAFYGLLVNPGYISPIETLEELEESELIMETAIVIKELKESEAPSSLDYVLNYKSCGSTLEECFKKVAIDRTHAVYASRIEGTMMSYLYSDRKLIPLVTPLNKIINREYIVTVFTRLHCILQPVFEKTLSRYLTTGIINHHVEDCSTSYHNLQKRKRVHERIFGFSLQHLQGAFYILLVGHFLSCVIYVNEIILYSISKYFYLSVIMIYLKSIRLF